MATHKSRVNKMRAQRLVDWFLNHRRQLPWRPQEPQGFRDPYRVWISEIMLQQTQVETVREYYLRWMEHFPSVQALAQASDADVMRCWQGLGYYSRARNIIRTARIVVSDYQGEFPTTRVLLEKLPGIGAYTAGAILSLAMGQQEPILDGNLVRIFSRWQGLDFLPHRVDQKAVYWGLSKEWCAAGPAGLVNESLMELGALVCVPGLPRCEDCPLSDSCFAKKQQEWHRFPPRKVTATEDWYGVALVLENSQQEVWCVRDSESFFLKSHFNFPIIQKKEAEQNALPLVAQYLGVSERQLQPLVQWCHQGVRHAITRYRIRIQVLKVVLDHTPENDGAWVRKEDVLRLMVNSLGVKIWRVVGECITMEAPG